MVADDLPVHPSTATASWVTAALREGGVLRQAVVTDVRSEEIGAGVGILGELGRLHLTYDVDEPGAPATVILKLPSQYEANRQLGMMLHFYDREVWFYREIAPKIDLRVPRCYWSFMDEDAHKFALLLEDFAGFAMEDQLTGISRARAAEAIGALAGFHAAWWESPVLDSLTWMPPVNGPITMQVAPAYREGWPVFLEHFGADLPEGSIELGERVGERFESLLDRAATPPLTICHADFRLDNLFFGPKGTRDAVALIDFQLVTTARGVFDVAYLLCQSMEVEERRASEFDLLRRWHAVVTKAGVGDYSLDQAIHDYKLASLICLCYPVTSGGTLDLANDRGVALVRAMAVRTFTAALDLEAASLLD